MSTVQQGGYVNNIVDGGFTNLSDSVQYDECLENVDKSDYDQLSPDKDGLNHDYIILTSSLKAVSKQSDNEVHRRNKSLMRPIFLIMCCILISAGVTAAATFIATKHFYSENREKYTDSTQCKLSSDNGYNETISRPGSCLIEPCENGGTCDNFTCLCEDGFAGSKCEIGDYLAVSYICNGACRDCVYFIPDCMGYSDGVYRNVYVEPPGGHYFECQDERLIYDGRNPCQTNMAPYNGRCKDLYEIPTSYWHVGYGVDCTGRPNGNYESERRHRCDIYYTCVNGNSTLSHCRDGTVFDSKSLFCQSPANACRPCGSVDNGC